MTANTKQEISSDYLRVLPLVNYASSLYPGLSLENTYLLCAQHLVSTTYSLFHTLIQLGLEPSNLAAIGKCYSTDPEAFQKMQDLGIDVCPTSLNFDSSTSFDQQYKLSIQEFISKRIERINSPKIKKVIVLDDGGDLILELKNSACRHREIIAIEQTSSGYHKLKSAKLDCPIINVARSPAKLIHESPIISELVTSTLVSHLAKLDISPDRLLIIGNGAIGGHIAQALSDSSEISIYDHIPEKCTLQGTSLESCLDSFDVIIGCTGKPALSEEQLNMLKENTVLVSASSSDREFNASQFRQSLLPFSNCHTDVFAQNKWLINCGFPVNFSADFRKIDCDKLQLTRSLLLTSILQAVRDVSPSERGFIPLDLECQRAIIGYFYKLFPDREMKQELALVI